MKFYKLVTLFFIIMMLTPQIAVAELQKPDHSFKYSTGVTSDKSFLTMGEGLGNKIWFISIVGIVLFIVGFIVIKMYITYLRRVIHGEQKFSKDVLDRTHMLVWSIQGDTMTSRFNQYAEQLTGMSEGDMLGKRLDEMKGLNDSVSDLISLLLNALDMKFVDQEEMSLLDRDGVNRCFIFRTMVVHSVEGIPDTFVLVGIDINDRKEYEVKLQLSYQELESTYEELSAAEEVLKQQFDELMINQEKLYLSEQRFRLASDGAGAIIWEMTHPDSEIFFSERWYEIMGYTTEEANLLPGGPRSLIHPDDREQADVARIAHIEWKTPVYESQYRAMTKSGEVVWFQSRGKAIHDPIHDLIRFSGSLIDITERKESERKLQNSYEELEATYEQLAAAQQELVSQYGLLVENQVRIKRNEEKYRLIIEASNSGIWETNLLTKETTYSSRCYELLGYLDEDDAGQLNMRDLFYPGDYQLLIASVEQHIAEKSDCFLCEYRLKLKNGDYRWFLGRGKVLLDETGQAYRLTGSNIDNHELKEHQAGLQRLAYYDSLSQLPNRLYLLETLDNYFKCPESMAAIFFVDTDNFKYINDTLGHRFGDVLIQQVSERLQTCIRSQDMLFRFGGDEFVVFCKELDHEAEIGKLPSQIIEGFKEPFLIDESILHVSVSIGISYSENCTTGDEMLKNADVAMYRAKESGKGNYCFYDQSMQKSLQERMVIEKYLRNAADNEEFELYYQPQVDMRTGRISGFEALIRWNSPQLGFMSPLTFIKIAEDSRLIIPIGEWVLRKASIFMKSLHDRGHSELKISVNISVVQLVQNGFIDTVLEILAETGLNPRHIELEITESIFMENFEDIILKLEKLKSLGVGIALDDFGTGYSSLSYLKQLPISTLKIDKMFIDSLLDTDDHQSLTETIVTIGHIMGLEVVAEGIEVKEQLTYLKNLDCDRIQGYFISRPIAEQDVISLLAQSLLYEI